jgi:hypothetical protein
MSKSNTARITYLGVPVRDTAGRFAKTKSFFRTLWRLTKISIVARHTQQRIEKNRGKFPKL